MFCFKHGSQYSVFRNGYLMTENIRTSKQSVLRDFKLVLFLQVVVFLSLHNECVNGENTSPSRQNTTSGTQRDMNTKVHNSIHGSQRGMNTKAQQGRRQDMPVLMTAPTERTQVFQHTVRLRTTTRRRRTTIYFDSVEDSCHHLAKVCLRAYQTGKLCARTIYYKYYNFKNYCMLDFVNCMHRYTMWQVIHMGDCINIKIQTSIHGMTDESSRQMQEIYMQEKQLGN